MSSFENDGLNVDKRWTEDVLDATFFDSPRINPERETKSSFGKCLKHILFFETSQCMTCCDASLMCLICFTEKHLGHVFKLATKHYGDKVLSLEKMDGQKRTENKFLTTTCLSSAKIDEVVSLSPPTSFEQFEVIDIPLPIAEPKYSFYAAFAYSDQTNPKPNKMFLLIGRVEPHSSNSKIFALKFLMQPTCPEKQIEGQYRREKRLTGAEILVRQEHFIAMGIKFDKGSCVTSIHCLVDCISRDLRNSAALLQADHCLQGRYSIFQTVSKFEIWLQI
jgi:hypothetical protein